MSNTPHSYIMRLKLESQGANVTDGPVVDTLDVIGFVDIDIPFNLNAKTAQQFIAEFNDLLVRHSIPLPKPEDFQ